ncbi:Pullulanase precursor [compost metagenome]
MHTREQIENNIELIQCRDNVVAFQLKNHANGDTWGQILVFYNANQDSVEVEIPESSSGWHIAVNDHSAGTSSLGMVFGDVVKVPRLSIKVLYQ